MGVIKLKIKNLIYLCICLSLCFIFYLLLIRIHKKPVSEIIFGEGVERDCNPHLRWYQNPASSALARQAVVGILGAPGSGEVWLRQLIEQVTGYYTGSVSHNLTRHFAGEGKSSQVIAVLGHDVDEMPPMSSGIIIYRDLKDTIRTQFVQQQEPHSFIEAPLQTYYGTKWIKFAQKETRRWIERYNSYLDINIPTLIVSYEQLQDPTQLQNQLLRISNQLHVPIKKSVLQCLVQTSKSSPLLPKPLKRNFNPFDLLQKLEVIKLEQAELRVKARLEEAHDRFRPKV